MPGILIVVDRELNEEQIDGTGVKNVPAQAEGTGCRASGGNARIDELELGLGES